MTWTQDDYSVGYNSYRESVVRVVIIPSTSYSNNGPEKRVSQLLDYLATHPDAKIRYHASDMVLNIHSDASYLSEIGAKSSSQIAPGASQTY